MNHWTKLAVIFAILIIVIVALIYGVNSDIVKEAIKALIGIGI